MTTIQPDPDNHEKLDKDHKQTTRKLPKISSKENLADLRVRKQEQHDHLQTTCKEIRKKARLVLLYLSAEFLLFTCSALIHVNHRDPGAVRLNETDLLYTPCYEDIGCFYGKLEVLHFNAAFLVLFLFGSLTGVCGFYSAIKRRANLMALYALRCLTMAAICLGWTIWTIILSKQPNTETVENETYGMLSIFWIFLMTVAVTGAVLSGRYATILMANNQIIQLEDTLVRPTWTILMHLNLAVQFAGIPCQMLCSLIVLWHMTIYGRQGGIYKGIKVARNNPIEYHMIDELHIVSSSYIAICLIICLIEVFTITRRSVILCRVMLACSFCQLSMHTLLLCLDAARNDMSWASLELLSLIVYGASFLANWAFHGMLIRRKREDDARHTDTIDIHLKPIQRRKVILLP